MVCSGPTQALVENQGTSLSGSYPCPRSSPPVHCSSHLLYMGEPCETYSLGRYLQGWREVEMQFLESSPCGESHRQVGGGVLTQLQTDTHGLKFSVIRIPLKTPVPQLLTVECGVCSQSPVVSAVRQLRVTILKSFHWLSRKFLSSKIRFSTCHNSLLA